MSVKNPPGSLSEVTRGRDTETVKFRKWSEEGQTGSAKGTHGITKGQQKVTRGSARCYQGLKGAGGFFDLWKVKIEFSIVSDRGECELPDAFYWIKKILFLDEVVSNFENTGHYSTRAMVRWGSG